MATNTAGITNSEAARPGAIESGRLVKERAEVPSQKAEFVEGTLQQDFAARVARAVGSWSDRHTQRPCRGNAAVRLRQ